MGEFFEFFLLKIFLEFGEQAIKIFSLLFVLLPFIVYSSSEWLIFVMQSHAAHLNIYKVMETIETTDDSMNDLAALAVDHLPTMRRESTKCKQDLGSHV